MPGVSNTDMGIERILIVRLSHLGDVIHSLPLLAALRDRYPQAHIAWLVEDSLAPFLFHLDILDEPIVMPRKELRATKSLRQRVRLLWRLFRRLRSRRFQVVIDAHGLTKSAIWGVLSGASTRIGFTGKDGREISRWLNNTFVLPSADKRHVIDLNLSLLEPLGITDATAQFPMPVCADAAQKMAVYLKEISPHHPPCLISPGAGWETKRWPAERYGEFATALAQKTTIPVIVLWGPGEESLRDTVLSAANSELVFPAPATDTLEMTEIMRRSGVLITNDTGPLHMAVALGIPTVSIFGPSCPIRNGPYGSDHRVVRASVSCLDCWKAICPLEDRLCCMNQVSVESVLKETLEILA